MYSDQLELEQQLLRCMRPVPVDVLEYDGWQVGVAANDAKRSRSVCALGTSTLPVEEKISWCEHRYADRGLPPVFRMTSISNPRELDDVLAARGYQCFEPSHVLVRPATATLPEARADVSFESPSLDVWLATTGRISGRPEATSRAISRRLAASEGDLHPLALTTDRTLVAYGLAMLDGSYCGLFDIHVAESQRRHGFGTALCASLIEYGQRHSASITWLSVLADNMPAQRLYAGLGFEFAYEYWYRVEPEGVSS